MCKLQFLPSAQPYRLPFIVIILNTHLRGSIGRVQWGSSMCIILSSVLSCLKAVFKCSVYLQILLLSGLLFRQSKCIHKVGILKSAVVLWVGG